MYDREEEEKGEARPPKRKRTDQEGEPPSWRPSPHSVQPDDSIEQVIALFEQARNTYPHLFEKRDLTMRWKVRLMFPRRETDG